MKKTFTFLIMVFLFAAVSAQTVVVTFTGRDTSNQYVPLNRVVVSNLTKGWQETLTWPDDTVLTMTDHTGVEDAEALRATPLRLSQNTPNPFDGTTFAILQVAERGDVSLEITDITGRIVGANNYSSLRPGIHEIRITLSSAGIYFLTARQNGRISSVKMVNRSNGGGNSIAFVGGVQPKNGVKDVIDNLFEVGDQMEYVGYATIDGAEWGSDHIVQEQYVSQLVVLNFDISVDVADGMPCPSTPTVVDHEGNIYNTVKIGNQCWMRENMRCVTSPSTGTYIVDTTYNSTYTGKMAKRYRHYDSITVDSNFGLLYNWNAMMDTFNIAYGETSVDDSADHAFSVNYNGYRRGICPAGWHLPTEDEWWQLLSYVMSQPDYWCGSYFDDHIAKALASTTSWSYFSDECSPGHNLSTNNATGFSAMPAGTFTNNTFPTVFPTFCSAYFWTATQHSKRSAKSHSFPFSSSTVDWAYGNKCDCYSVRCIRGDDTFSVITPPTVTTDSVMVTHTLITMVTCGGDVVSDGGAPILTRGVCWSTSPNPTVEDSHTFNGDSLGSFTSTLIGLMANTTYYVRAYATNEEGIAYGNEVVFSMQPTDSVPIAAPCPGIPVVTDIEGNVYNTVLIGAQCWMRENLRTAHYSDGAALSLNGCYDHSNSSIPLEDRGLFYNWNVAMRGASSSNTNPSGVQGVCPIGWHLPSYAEWTQFSDYLESQSLFVCGDYPAAVGKSLSSPTGWWNNSQLCTVGNSQSTNNVTGFSAVPVGLWKFTLDDFAEQGVTALFWSTTTYYSFARVRYLSYVNDVFFNYEEDKAYGLSVRCLRDSLGGSGHTVFLPTVTTDSVSNVTANSATCGGVATTDGGATIVGRGVCWGTSENPTIAGNHTSDSTGLGPFTSHITGLSAGTTYYVRAYVTNSIGTTYGMTMAFTTEPPTPNNQPCPNAPWVLDYEGNSYNTIQIGNQCWMRENLRSTYYADGEPIPAGNSNTSYTNPYYYDSGISIPLVERGYLYNWPAVMHGASSTEANPSGVQGICPDGWHLPSNAEWSQLINYLGSVSDYCCGSNNTFVAKAMASQSGWQSSFNSCTPGYNQLLNNLSGFGAVPVSNYNGTPGLNAVFWSSSAESATSNLARCRTIDCNASIVWQGLSHKDVGISVRCLRD
jgi:uncharacterized protein (TIGR02145 family)